MFRFRKRTYKINGINLNNCFSPRSLGVEVVDVVRHRVVVKHRRVFLLEIRPDRLDQHRTWERKGLLQWLLAAKRCTLITRPMYWAEYEIEEYMWGCLCVCSPRGPASRSAARGLKGLMTAPMALIHTGMEWWLGFSGRAGKPHGSTSTRCFTLHTQASYFL